MAKQPIGAPIDPNIFGPVGVVIADLRAMVPKLAEIPIGPDFEAPGPFHPVPILYVHFLAAEIERMGAEIARLAGLLHIITSPEGSA